MAGDERDALRQVLEEKCPDAIGILKDDDIMKLVAAGFSTAAVLAAATEKDLFGVLPGRPGVVAALLKAFVQPAGKPPLYKSNSSLEASEALRQVLEGKSSDERFTDDEIYKRGGNPVSSPEVQVQTIDQDYRQKEWREELDDKVQDHIRAKGQEIRGLREEIRGLREEIRAKEEEIRANEEEIRGVEKEIVIASGTEVRKLLEAKLQFLRQEISSLRQEISSCDQQISSRDQQISSRDQQIVSLQQGISSVRSVQEVPASAGQSNLLPGTQEELVFWKNLGKAELKSVTVSINQDADMEVDEIPGNQVTVTILELQDNSKFMGVQGGMSSIMVPKFYNDLWEKAERLIDKNTGRKGMVITGTPGTGKSVMGWYFIYKLRMKLGSFDLVYQHQRSETQTLYSKDGTVTSAATAAQRFRHVLSSKDTVYVVDGDGVLSQNAKTFVFASPHPRSYNGFLKERGRVLYCSKVWSKIEILAARQLLYKDIDESLVLDLYRKWGGVPRHVLEKAEDSNWQIGLHSKIQSVSGDEWLDFMTKVGQGRSEISDVILHFKTEDYEWKTVVFASSYVSELAYTTLEKGAWVKTVEFLEKDDPASAAFRGQLFETAAHKMLVRKCRVRVRSLEGNGQSEIEGLDWPELQRRKFRKLTDVKEEGSVGWYWKPSSMTNATFNAVCTSIGAPLGTSAALQMTISKKHGIKHDGLVKLPRAVPSVKRFYWVVPTLIFEDFKKQRFENKDSEPRIRATSNSVSGVEQWALELPLTYFHPGAVQS